MRLREYLVSQREQFLVRCGGQLFFLGEHFGNSDAIEIFLQQFQRKLAKVFVILPSRIGLLNQPDYLLFL